ncbi:hypothetical protein [Microbacterium sp. NPDC087591]|uniref:hypothetical protein n=1 Tax=Microbacterium sp. NPDC087591 TaxID=3364192 RepID=UPI0038269A40
MQLLERVREIGADEAQVAEESIQNARRALNREIAGGLAPRARRRRLRAWTGIGIGGLVAGAAVTAIVVGSVVAPPSTPIASAAVVLAEAAEVTLTTEALTPAPGQYIRISETWTQPMRGFVPEEGTEIDVTYTLSRTRTLYVPADRSEDWIEDSTDAEKITDVSEPQWKGRIEEQELSGGRMLPDIVAHPGGRIMGGDGWETHYYHLSPMSRLYGQMPRDPQALLDWLAAYEPDSGYPPPRLTEPIDFNLAPADLRAAMFQTMALLPGARVVSQDGDFTTVAIPDGGESNWMETVTIDMRRGLMVGRSSLDSPESRGSLDVSIVDSAPAGVHLQPEN